MAKRNELLEEARKALRNKAYVLAGTDRDNPEKRKQAIKDHEKAAIAFTFAYAAAAHEADE